MGEFGAVLGLLLGLVMMAVGFLVLYFIIKAAVKNGVLQALDDPRATLGAHKVITQLRGGGQRQATAQQSGQYPPHQ